MGGAIAIISTIASVASSFSQPSSRQRRQESPSSDSSGLAAKREAENKRRADEKRQRKIEQRDDARELERIQKTRQQQQKSTIATSGAGLLGMADVGKSGLKNKLGE